MIIVFAFGKYQWPVSERIDVAFLQVAIFGTLCG